MVYGVLQLLKFDLNLLEYGTQIQVKQHRRATEEVSKCAEENRALHEFIRFSHNISGFDMNDHKKCKLL